MNVTLICNPLFKNDLNVGCRIPVKRECPDWQGFHSGFLKPAIRDCFQIPKYREFLSQISGNNPKVH
jgi:hypothetical protein